MNCQECKQRPATVHLTKIFNNQKTELHLCEECAKHHDEIPFNFGFSMEPNFSIQKFLAGLLGSAVAPAGGGDGSGGPGATDTGEEAEEALAAVPHCSNCGMTYSQFRQIGRFGCSQCYLSFAGQLELLLRRVQGNSRHTGKVPLRVRGLLGYKREIEQLRQELQANISAEAYERAAVLRDRIHALEGKIGG
ncbi:MAG: UvrB/UvrC motif-containing protein [Thermacetogeniaceae bacterium]|jgi:protein arginine kinase activator